MPNPYSDPTMYSALAARGASAPPTSVGSGAGGQSVAHPEALKILNGAKPGQQPFLVGSQEQPSMQPDPKPGISNWETLMSMYHALTNQPDKWNDR